MFSREGLTEACVWIWSLSVKVKWQQVWIAASLSFCCSSFPRNICMKSLENDCLLLFGWMIESPVILLFSLRFLMLCWGFKRMEVCVLSAELVEIFYKKMSLANFHHSAFTFHLHAFGWQIYVKLGIVLIWECCWKLAACHCWVLKALEVVDILLCQSRCVLFAVFPFRDCSPNFDTSLVCRSHVGK